MPILTVDHRFKIDDLPIALRVNVRKVVIPLLFMTIACSALGLLILGAACNWRAPLYGWVMMLVPWWVIWTIIASSTLLDRRTLKIDEVGIQSGSPYKLEVVRWEDITGVAPHTEIAPRTGVKVRTGIDLTVGSNGGSRIVTIPTIYAINDSNLRALIIAGARQYGTLAKEPEGHVDSIARITDGLVGGDFRRVGQ